MFHDNCVMLFHIAVISSYLAGPFEAVLIIHMQCPPLTVGSRNHSDT